MKLEECTKEELMFMIKRITEDSFISHFKVRAILADIEMKRTSKIAQEADRWAELAADYRNQYTEILKKYGHLKVADMPHDAIKKADNCLKQARMCDRKWEECMKRLGD